MSRHKKNNQTINRIINLNINKTYAWNQLNLGDEANKERDKNKAIYHYSNIKLRHDQQIYASAQFKLGKIAEHQHNMDQARNHYLNIKENYNQKIYTDAQLRLKNIFEYEDKRPTGEFYDNAYDKKLDTQVQLNYQNKPNEKKVIFERINQHRFFFKTIFLSFFVILIYLVFQNDEMNYLKNKKAKESLLQSKNKVTQSYSKACSYEYNEACIKLAFILFAENKKLAQKYQLAIETNAQNCNNEDSTACANLDSIFSQLYAKACDKGDTSACSNLAYLYSKGVGATQDRAKAGKLYSNNCNSGDYESCWKFANLYKDGYGMMQSYQKLIELLTNNCHDKDDIICQLKQY